MLLKTCKNFNAILEMYEEYFPSNEKKDVALLQGLIENDRATLLALVDQNKDNRIAAFAFCYDSGKNVLIDYLAVNKNYRNGGVGGLLIKGIKKYYADKDTVVLEIERLGRAATKDENDIRIKRKSFYFKNGADNSGFFVTLDNVEMEVLILPMRKNNITKTKYKAIYNETFEKAFVDWYVGKIE